MSDELFHRILSLLIYQGEKLRQITLTGGEPLLHPHLEKFIEKLAQRTRRVALATNGLLLNKDRLNSLVDAGLSKVSLRVDSLKRKPSGSSTGTHPGGNIRDTLEMLRQTPIQLELSIVLTELSGAEIRDILSYCKDTHIPAKFFEHINVESLGDLHTPGKMHADPLFPFQEFQRAVYSIVSELTCEYSAELGGANVVFAGSGLSVRYCHYLCDYGLCSKAGTRIDSTGSVYTCMKRRGQFVISPSEDLKASAKTISRALKEGCGPTIGDKTHLSHYE